MFRTFRQRTNQIPKLEINPCLVNCDWLHYRLKDIDSEQLLKSQNAKTWKDCLNIYLLKITFAFFQLFFNSTEGLINVSIRPSTIAPRTFPTFCFRNRWLIAITTQFYELMQYFNPILFMLKQLRRKTNSELSLMYIILNIFVIIHHSD